MRACREGGRGVGTRANQRKIENNDEEIGDGIKWFVDTQPNPCVTQAHTPVRLITHDKRVFFSNEKLINFQFGNVLRAYVQSVCVRFAVIVIIVIIVGTVHRMRFPSN